MSLTRPPKMKHGAACVCDLCTRSWKEKTDAIAAAPAFVPKAPPPPKPTLDTSQVTRIAHVIEPEQIGLRVRECRLAHGITQQELADRTRCKEHNVLNVTYITAVERGRVNTTVRNVMRIIDALHMTPAEFFAGGAPVVR